MRLTAGTKVGPYEVLALLGAGGMAEVYRARDTRLGRDVALKVVNESLGKDTELLARLEREAKLGGSLNHPNVVAVYDVGVHDGSPYFVTELLQGETLRERLAKGAVPLSTALEWAGQMAQGLAAAHERGIIHRDLKPENVFITRDGHVKLLDFGIAKLAEAARAAAAPTRDGLMDPTASPSGSTTGTGIVLGTPGYMSPEQVRGDAVDALTDFFSLGSVLYELVSGRRAFPAGPVVESGYATLHNEPEPLPATVPPQVAQVVHRCLEKDPARRFQSARDLAFNLELLRSPTGSIGAATNSSLRARWRRWWWFALPVAAAGFVVVALRLGAPIRDSPSSVRRLTFREGLVTAARFGADSRTVYFSASWRGEPEKVYSTTSDEPDYHPLGIDDARLQAVSQSGELAVLLHPRVNTAAKNATGTLARIPGVGGAPREIATDVAGADWAPDGSKMVITRETANGYRVEYPLGKTVYESSHPLGPPRLSSRGGRIAVVEYAIPFDSRGDVIVIEPGLPKRILVENFEDVTGLAWSPKGDELWFSGLPVGLGQQLSLWAVSLSGHLRMVQTSVGTLHLDDIAEDGRALVLENQLSIDVGLLNVGQKTANVHLGWFDAPLLVAVSADGHSMLLQESGRAGEAFGASKGGGAYWTFLQPTDGSPPVRLGPGSPSDLTRDGKWALTYDPLHSDRIWLLPTGPGTSRSIDFPGLTLEEQRGYFLPNGTRAVAAVQLREGVRVEVLDLESGTARAVTPPLRTPVIRLSPDGRFIAAEPLDGGWTVYPVEEGLPKPLAGLGRDEALIAWTNGGLLVSPELWPDWRSKPPVRIFRVNPENATRQLFTTIGPADAPGADAIWRIRVTPDAQTVAYSYERETSTLYLFDFRADANKPGHQR